MTIFTINCRFCGAPISVMSDSGHVTCEYCRRTVPTPKIDDSKVSELYNQANDLRTHKDFDKAQMVYRQLATERPDDAEAFWCAALCKFGIEYVETRAGRKPTLHRMQFDSILEDGDYREAISRADMSAAALYEAEAREINDIQQQFLEIYHREPPYDVFISFKAETPDGERTRDSVYAQEIYDELTNRGYRVFFSRITLAGKAGEAFEPHIFAALHSATVMIVVGTSEENFNATWVKNEWSRYLHLMKTDRNKHIVPVFRDMDLRDLPPEFEFMQKLDFSRIGAMQDLIKGVESYLLQKPAAREGAGVGALMLRAQMLIDDGDFTGATEIINRVLDIDPQFAPAHMLKLLIARGYKSFAELEESFDPIEGDADFERARKFANKQQLSEYEARAKRIQENISDPRKFNYALALAYVAGDESQLRAESRLQKVALIRETSALRERFLASSAKNDPGEISAARCEQAINLFRQMLDYEDSRALAGKCADMLTAIDARNRLSVLRERMADTDDYRELDQIAQRAAEMTGVAGAAFLAKNCRGKAQKAREAEYEQLSNEQERLNSVADAERLISKWKALAPYADSEARIAQCRERLKQLQINVENDLRKTISGMTPARRILDIDEAALAKKNKYDQLALKTRMATTAAELEMLQREWRDMGVYLDSAIYMEKCREQSARIRAEESAAREAERRAAVAMAQTEKRKKTGVTLCVCAAIAVIVIVLIVIL